MVAGSILIAAVVAEGMTRVIDGLPLFTDWLPNTVDRDVSATRLDEIPRAAGVSRSWFFEDPPPLPNRHAVPPEWMRIAQEISAPTDAASTAFRPEDFFKAWNSAFAGNPCQQPLLKQAPGRLYVYQSLDGTPHPRYRFLPNATMPSGLVTNQIGWRGAPLEIRRTPKVVRIVFIGASTTLNGHSFPFSYPEFVGHWLNLWAAAHKLDVRFEALNAARDGLSSTDVEAIVRTEVLPLRPDLVVFYPAADQLNFKFLLDRLPDAEPARPAEAASESGLSRWLRDASNRSALARRLQYALGMVANPGRGDEWPKPDYQIAWPADEHGPDISRPDLPLNLSNILRSLDGIRADLAGIGAEFALSSYIWMAHEGMVLDPVSQKYMLEFLNVRHFPFRYRDMERAATLNNLVLAKYAAAHRLPFFDLARLIPKDTGLFLDPAHMTYYGIRLHAWIVLQDLVPLVEEHLKRGTWGNTPVPVVEPPLGLLFTPREIAVGCNGG